MFLQGVGGHRVRAEGGVLVFTSVARSDEGEYSVTATNSEGASSASVRVRVLFPPRIVGITREVMVGQGEPAHLECAVDAR